MKPIDFVLLIEHSSYQASVIITHLKTEFPEVRVVHITSEEKALRCFVHLKSPLVFVVSDLILPWTSDKKSRNRLGIAGTRCWRKFRETFTDVPWVYFTVFDSDLFDFASNSDPYTGYVQKDGPSSLDRLNEEIARLLPDDETNDEIPPQVWEDPAQREALLTEFRSPLEIT